MSLTTRQQEIIQSTFAAVAPQAEMVAELFYGRLFEIAPQVQPMFANSNMKEQGKKLMQTLAVVVHSVNRLEEIIPEVEALGRRHINYGVEAAHYSIVGEALIWTLQQGLGEAFTDEVQKAWVTTYTLLVDVATSAYSEDILAN